MSRYWILFLLLVCSCTQHSEKLTIAAATNTREAVEELKKEFEKQSGTSCEVVFASSGKLTAQIRSGAPFHIFLAADLEYPQLLFEEGLSQEAPETYAIGQLVLWSGIPDWVPEIENLTEAQVEHIAVANPEFAPYGKAAREVLKNRDIFGSIESKLVYGESVTQTNQFFLSGAARVALTAKSSIVGLDLQQYNSWQVIDPSSHSPLRQGVVILKSGSKDQLEAAGKFRDFLFSESGRQILEKHGYQLPDEQPQR